MKLKTFATITAALLVVFIAEHASAAAANDGTVARAPQMTCDASSESCCKAWVENLLQQLGSKPNPADALASVPRRVDLWIRYEHRNYCAVRKDIEARYFSK